MATTYGLSKKSTTYGTSIWRSRMERVGNNFKLKEVRIPLAQAVAANQTIVVKVYTDDASSNYTIATINNTNYPSSERFIKIYPTLGGKNNFFIELTFSGSALAVVGLPITTILEIDRE